jgi:5'-AMP-activated protein kinase regulatory beta subunit
MASTHDFNTVLRLPPGQYRMKFIVDDSWRCSNQLPTATDDDGTLVNWIEVEAVQTDEELKADWSKPHTKSEDG